MKNKESQSQQVGGYSLSVRNCEFLNASKISSEDFLSLKLGRRTNHRSNKLQGIAPNLSNRLLIFSGILLMAILLFIIFNNGNTLQKREIITNFIIGDKFGFDLNNSALTFGMLPPGTKSYRTIEIKNDFNRRVLVSIYSSKNIVKFMRISENDFYLNPGEIKSVSFSLYADKNSTFRKYCGFVNVVFKKPGVFK